MQQYRLFFLLAGLITVPQLLIGQARLVLSGDAYLVLDNAVQVVLENPNPNAITVLGNGNIVSEAENDLILWAIGPNSGTYQIPWTTGNNVKIPLTVNLTSAGVGPGFFRLSTHTDDDAVNNWDNYDYRPSDVTNMGGPSIPNNSASVVDRFWRIEHVGYTTAPQAQLLFSYDDAERTAVGNTIPAGSMFAQRFDPGQGVWLLPGTGTDNFPVLTVSGADASTNFFRSWTLSTRAVPLDLGGLTLETERAGTGVQLTWEVDGALTGERFVLARSADGEQFVDLAVQAFVSGQEHYGFSDARPLAGMSHYQVRLLDRDGQAHYSQVRSVRVGGQVLELVPNPMAGNALNLLAQGYAGENLSLHMMDLAGRKVWAGSWEPEGENAQFRAELEEGLPVGVYLLQVREADGSTHVLRLLRD